MRQRYTKPKRERLAELRRYNRALRSSDGVELGWALDFSRAKLANSRNQRDVQRWTAAQGKIADAYHRVGISIPGLRRTRQRPPGPALARLDELKGVIGQRLESLIVLGLECNESPMGYVGEGVEFYFAGGTRLHISRGTEGVLVDTARVLRPDGFAVDDRVWCAYVDCDFLEDPHFCGFSGVRLERWELLGADQVAKQTTVLLAGFGESGTMVYDSSRQRSSLSILGDYSMELDGLLRLQLLA